jgi:DNA (cytosine-5)-methyltransferase 1
MARGDGPTVIDLFCGAGGLSLGFVAAGALILAAVDSDEEAGRTYRANFDRLQPDLPPVIITREDADLAQVRPWEVVPHVEPDILVGSPPCQPFSTIGRGKLDSLSEEGFIGDRRNELYRAFVSAVGHWRPRAFVMENVPGMLWVDGRNVAEEATAELAGNGYEAGYVVLNAAWYGVPQYRARLFVIGIRRDIGRMPLAPPATHRAEIPPGYLRSRDEAQLQLPLPSDGPAHHGDLPVDLASASVAATSVAEALDDLPVLIDHLEGRPRPRAEFRRPLAYSCPPHSGYARLMRTWPGLPEPTTVEDHAIRRTPRDYETFARMRPGDRYPEALAIALRRVEEEEAALREAGKEADRAELVTRIVPPYPEDVFVDKWRKLRPDRPAWTVTAHLAKDSYSHIHHDSGQARAISVREAARLQSFPDAFSFVGNMGECFRQIGNAVPPLMAWAIAATLLETLGLMSSHPPFGRHRDRRTDDGHQ